MTDGAARLPMLAPDEVPDDVRRIFEAFLRERGNIPNLFRSVALRPPIVRTLFEHIRAVMGPGEVSQLLKELLSVRVSHLNACAYCLASHNALAKRHGATDAQLAAVARGDVTSFEPAWQAAFAVAERITPSRGTLSDEEFDQLAGHWSASQIVEIVCVVTLFNHFNRIAEALRVPVTR